MSINWLLDVDPRPAILVRPSGAESLDEAHAAIELWEHYKRRCLDPAQRLTVEVMMATRAGGLWAAQTTGREEPRQNGKGDEIEVVELWGLVQRAERILHTVHDAVLLATETQSRLLSTIDSHADLRRLKARAWLGTGQQMIEMRNGGIIWYRTRTGGGARGVDEVDRIVVDEAQHAEPEHLAAITPTQLASANPQLNALGTSGIAGKSAWWWQQRRRALSAPQDFGYVGHTAENLTPDGTREINVRDRALWRQANPALVAGRAPESYFVEQLERLGDALFAREHLGVWDPEDGGDVPEIVSAETWRKTCDPKSGPTGPVGFALDVSPARSWASFGVAGRSGRGGEHIELVDRRRGTAWLVGRAAELQSRWGGRLAVAEGSPAWSLVPELEAAGVDVFAVSTKEHAQACGALFDGLEEGRIRHLGQPELTAAVDNAARRFYGDAWLWSRKAATADITPLVAVTLALWASRQLVPAPAFIDLGELLEDE